MPFFEDVIKMNSIFMVIAWVPVNAAKAHRVSILIFIKIHKVTVHQFSITE